MTGPDWGLGDYAPTAAQLEPAAVAAVERAAPIAGEVALDVGCGTGNAALLVAATGASVTAVDPSPRLLELAAFRAAAAEVEIEFTVGAAEELPVPDASVDVVLSVFGVIFAADPDAAVAELARVTRPAGRIVFTAWLPGNAVSQATSLARAAVMRAIGAAAAPGFAWHDRAALESVFRSRGLAIELEEASLVQRAASLDDYLRTVLDVHPLAVGARPLLERTGEAEGIRAQTRALLEDANEDPDAFAITMRYVIVRATAA